MVSCALATSVIQSRTGLSQAFGNGGGGFVCRSESHEDFRMCGSHFIDGLEATQKLNKLRDKNPIVKTRGPQAPTVLAGVLRSLTVRKIAITSNELGIKPNDLR